jgi:Uma2 family endonuclease
MTNSKTDQAKLTHADLLRMPEDHLRHEIIDGVHFVNESPNLYHQTVLGRLYYQLYTQIELAGHGEVFCTPVDVVLTLTDVVVPDLVLVLSAHRSILTANYVAGAPDLIVEILSPSTRSVDLNEKRAAYQRTFVPEYWIVDPDQHVIDKLVLTGATYADAERCSEMIEYRGLAGVRVDLRQVW